MSSKIKVDSSDSGTSAWTEIFLLYPITGASIAHKLLARGLKTCLNFKNDSMVSALDYIASVNASASVFGGLDQPLFATRWSSHLFEILIPFLLLRDI